ncbi:energy transducer TonB [Malikia sp.]|uniref:energy transducer TonB n=1 Tax=Malikia sp. TaxID=2070706 RepID=UPI00262CC0AE|nr:energy transducer TonB [Malikia sp.]MDD2728475.1 energy transducer TonB [Malikia sp.]
MISLLMLPASPHFVKTGPAAALGSKRARRNQLTTLAVLSVHALLLGLLWNGQPARTPLPAPRPALIEVSVLAPATVAAAAVLPAGRNTRPVPAADRASHPAPAMATARTSSQPQPASASPDVTPALAAAPSQPAAASLDAASKANTVAASPSTAQQAAAATLHRPTDQESGHGQRTAVGQAPASAATRIERPDSSADYLDNPRPAYPPMSRRLGEQGQVMLRVWVEADGRPAKVEIGRGSGFDRLDRAALQAVQRWRFVPGKRAGLPEAMWTEVPLQFVLE